MRLFRRRHPTVSLRIPEATSIARVRAFTKAKVGRFFDLLESEMEKLKFSPDRIYNVDETGLCIVQSKKEAVIALKGKKQVGQLTSAERGALITVIACMNPVGQYIPPFLIFPRVKVPASYLDGTPFNTDYDCHKSGWIQMDIFTKWFQHFLKYAKPTKELPVLLILDGHNTHTRNADVIELARKNNVVIISIPPHTSHKTQPLDRTFMGPLKAYYSSEVRKFLRDKKRAVELRDVGALFGSAYKNAARYDIAENGFKCTGIYPVNRNIFTDNEYTPTPEENDELQDELNEDQPALTTTTISPIPIPPTDLNATSASTTTSTLPVQIPPVDSNTTLLSSSFILPEQITPIPVLEKKKKVTRGRKPGKSEIITSSPYKNALAEQQAKSKYKPITGNKKPTTKNGKPATRNRKVAKLSTSNDDPTENQPSTSSFNQPSTSSFNQPSTSSFNPSKNRPVRKSRRQLFELSSSSESEDDIVLSDSSGDDDNGEDDDPECIYCNEKYSDGKEGDDWIRCLKCSLWFHPLVLVMYKYKFPFIRRFPQGICSDH